LAAARNSGTRASPGKCRPALGHEYFNDRFGGCGRPVSDFLLRVHPDVAGNRTLRTIPRFKIDIGPSELPFSGTYAMTSNDYEAASHASFHGAARRDSTEHGR